MTEISPEILHTHTHQKKRRKKESTVDSYISIIYHGNCKAMNGSDCNWKKTNGTKPVSARMEREKRRRSFPSRCYATKTIWSLLCRPGRLTALVKTTTWNVCIGYQQTLLWQLHSKTITPKSRGGKSEHKTYTPHRVRMAKSSKTPVFICFFTQMGKTNNNKTAVSTVQWKQRLFFCCKTFVKTKQYVFSVKNNEKVRLLKNTSWGPKAKPRETEENMTAVSFRLH